MAILRTVENFINTHKELLSVNAEEGSYYAMRNVDLSPDFFFFIYKQKNESSNQLKEVTIEYSPSSENNLKSVKSVVHADNLSPYLEAWVKRLKDYNEIVSVYDDPIVKAYSDQFFEEYKILDADADYAPFNAQKLIGIDNYLEFIEANIDSKRNGTDDFEIDEIKADVQDLRKCLTKSTKNQVFRKLSTIWGKLQKRGLPLIKEFLTEAKKETLKFLIKNGIELIENSLK